jgi:hypothetical protein
MDVTHASERNVSEGQIQSTQTTHVARRENSKRQLDDRALGLGVWSHRWKMKN